jgi:hypothetical protein
MKKVFTFGMKYSQEKYAIDKLAGFTRAKIPEISQHWYGGNVKYLLKNGPVIVFMGESGPIDAGCLREELAELGNDDARACYENTHGKKPERNWQKPIVIEKLAGAIQ